MDTGGIPFIKLWGSNGQPHWSPDGSKIAFVSMRENHSLIGLYDVKTRKVSYVAPSVDCDGSPTWSGDGKQIAFLRRPGTPFGLAGTAGRWRDRQSGGPRRGTGWRSRRHRRRLRRFRRTRWWRWPRRAWRRGRRASDAHAGPLHVGVQGRLHAFDVHRTTSHPARFASSGTASRMIACFRRSMRSAGRARA